MNLSPLDALALGLATFYLAFALARTHGPFNVFKTLRERWPMGGLISCVYCLAFYAAIGAYLVWLVWPPALYMLAAAGGAAFLYRYTGGEAV